MTAWIKSFLVYIQFFKKGENKMLEGKKVVLRPLKREDAPYFVKWLNDVEVSKNITSYLPMNEVAEESWMRRQMEERHPVFTIEAKMPCEERRVIGNCGLFKVNHKNRNAEFGIMIGAKSFWGQGYGTEATKLIIDYGFKRLNLHKIRSSALAFNEASIKMHEKVGFKREGYHQDEVFVDGNYHGLIYFGIFAECWESDEDKARREKREVEAARTSKMTKNLAELLKDPRM